MNKFLFSYTLVLEVFMLSGFSACTSKNVITEKLGINIDSSYTMRTDQVDMLVSDSGLLRYRMISPLWLMYKNEYRNEWSFPKGIRLEHYDTMTISNQPPIILADTAQYLVPEEEWILKGRVRIHGLKGERLYTPTLHWLRKDRKLFSNDTTYFLTEGKELRGNRFEAKDDLSQYSIYQNSGVFVFEDQPSVSESSVNAK